MKNYILILSLLFLLACNSMDEHHSDTMKLEESLKLERTSQSPAYPKSVPANNQPTAPQANHQIIKNAHFKFEVADLDKSTQRIIRLCASLEGIVSDMKMTSSELLLENNLTLRLPHHHFEQALTALDQEAVFIDFKNVSSKDVTQEYIDLESRLKIKKEAKERYTELLRHQAKSMDEVLRAEEQIRKLQEEIESQEGRLRYLEDRVQFSTIQLSVYQQLVSDTDAIAEVPGSRLGNRVKASLFSGWSGLEDILISLMSIWPLCLVAILVYFRYRKEWGYFRFGNRL